MAHHHSFPTCSKAGPTWTGLAAALAATLALGATAGPASAQDAQDAQRAGLLTVTYAQAALADAQRDLARAALSEAEEQVRRGTARFEARIQAGADLAEAERRRSLLAFDIEEVTATGAMPRNDLQAPVVNGRDFVKLRIEANITGAKERLEAAQRMQAIVESQVRNNAVPTMTSAAAALGVSSAQAELAMLAEKLRQRPE